MSVIALHSVSFHHPSSEPLFTDVTLAFDTSWRTGLIGRNGRGKSTLLHLIAGVLEPDRGAVVPPPFPALFPVPVADEHVPALDAVRAMVAPFREWEREMERLLRTPDEPSLRRYGELEERYRRAGGYGVDGAIVQECSRLGLEEEALNRPWRTLSGGERTKGMVAALFLRKGSFPLLDEPTNHLDADGRERLGRYLSRKEGFIVVSHDRALLDACCDHIVAIERAGIRAMPGTYTDWKRQVTLEEETERARDASLRREIAQLETAAQQRRSWSFAREREKNSAADSGYVSHKAAKVMKRALSLERRIEERLEEKRSLLKNTETVRPLTLSGAGKPPDILLSLEEVTLGYGGVAVLSNFSLTVRKGERVALVGPNGCGKSTVLNAVRGTLPLMTGNRRKGAGVIVADVHQHPVWSTGRLREHLRAADIDETGFRTVMGSFGVCGDIFDRPLETFSEGERKKVDLCRSFLLPAHLLVWDEPVNALDIEARERIEEALLRDAPTMLFTEHDRRFVETVATRVVRLTREPVPGPRR